MASSGAYYRYRAYRRRKNGNGHGMSRWMMALMILGGLAMISVIVMAAVGYGVYRSYAGDLMPPDEYIETLPLGGAQIRDRNGEFLYEFFDDVSGLRKPVESEDISIYVIAATIAAEDASFLDNPGVNFRGLAAAAIDNFSPFGGSPGFLGGRGGSSITQQLVKNIYFTPEERAERSIERKMKETVIALELTRNYDKQQILEWYLNLISYGNVFIGIEAASEGYFDKPAKDLTLPEAALLAAIPSCPSCYDPINEPEEARRQRNFVLERMEDEGFIDKDAKIAAQDSPLGVDLQPFPINAPHFVLNVVRPELERLFGEEALRRDGLVVYTTLDIDLQHQAEDILEEWITTFEDSGGHNGAVVAIDPKTAETLVYVGSRDYFSEEIDGQNDMADALNSPGSSFKPFTYLTAFMNLGWGPGTMILDTPFPLEFWDGQNPPRNPGTGFQGPITVRNSLGNSLNIPAVKTIMYAGVQQVVDQATTMGITGLDASRLGPSMTIGGVDVKLNDMVYAYTAFPNLGILKGVESTVVRPAGNRTLDAVSILRVEDREGNVLYPIVDGEPSADGPQLLETRVAPAEQTYMISNILSDGSAQCIVFGCGGLGIGRPLAVKTGTSEPYETIGAIGDTWAIAYTPQLVVGSWFGNADNSPMTGITSTSVSWRTVRDFQLAYHEDLPVEQFTRPAGLVEGEVCIPSGLKADNDCAVKSQRDLLASDSLPSQDDNWWTVAEIDTRTGKLASALTPEEFVEKRFYLNLPAGLSTWQRNQALEWANKLENASEEEPPDESTQASDLPSAIISPAQAAQLSGRVSIGGRASSEDFIAYRLEYRYDTEPGDWVLIGRREIQVADGILGVWDTTGLPFGLYTLRLVVEDTELGEQEDRVQVLLIGTATTAPTPTVLPEQIE